MRVSLFIIFTGFLSLANGQILTFIATHDSGAKETLHFGFAPNATAEEDISLGESDIFLLPESDFEGRVLQRDSTNFSCSILTDYTEIYYPTNFDSKINLRDVSDTTLHNRLFEIWLSDNNIDSIEMICDIPFRQFLQSSYLFPTDCFGSEHNSPLGLWIIQDDTVKHLKYKLMQGFGLKQQIFITNPDLSQTTSAKEITHENTFTPPCYPNPTTGKLWFQSSDDNEETELFIYTSVGTLIHHQDITPLLKEIDLSFFPNGIYFIGLLLKDGNYFVEKIVKNQGKY